jgi:hypothetical protein
MNLMGAIVGAWKKKVPAAATQQSTAAVKA